MRAVDGFLAVGFRGRLLHGRFSSRSTAPGPSADALRRTLRIVRTAIALSARYTIRSPVADSVGDGRAAGDRTLRARRPVYPGRSPKGPTLQTERTSPPTLETQSGMSSRQGVAHESQWVLWRRRRPCTSSTYERRKVPSARFRTKLNKKARGGSFSPTVHVSVSTRELPVRLGILSSVFGSGAAALDQSARREVTRRRSRRERPFLHCRREHRHGQAP